MMFKDGELYWTLAHNEEAKQYLSPDEPARPRRPWQGRLTSVKRFGGNCFQIHGLKEDGSINEDANSYAVVQLDELYYDEHTASVAYVEMLRRYANRLMDTLGKVMKEMSDFHADQKRGDNAG